MNWRELMQTRDDEQSYSERELLGSITAELLSIPQNYPAPGSFQLLRFHLLLINSQE